MTQHLPLPAAPLHRLGAVGSTQDEASRLLAEGEPAPFVVASMDQRGGRGRLGRTWNAPAGSGIALTLALRTELPIHRRSWIPLLVGISALEVISTSLPVGVRLGLKWPNDLLVVAGGEPDAKLAGILVEGSGTDHVLIGIGVNLRGPVRDGDGALLRAAWLHGEGGLRAGTGEAAADQEALAWALAQDIAASVLAGMERLESAEGDADRSGIREQYRMRCATLGRRVRVQPAGGSGMETTGAAQDIDADGQLNIITGTGTTVAVGAGDVLHAGLLDAPPRTGDPASGPAISTQERMT